MWMILLRKYWLYLLLFLLFSVCFFYLTILKIENIKLEAEVSKLNTELETVAMIVESNKVDYDKNIEEYKKSSAKVETKWKTRIEAVYVWEDNNVSCEDAIHRLDNTVY